MPGVHRAFCDNSPLTKSMRPTVRWRILAVVLKDAWPIWLALGGVALAWATGWLFSTTPSGAVRWAGMMLQVLGLSTVAIGLRKMRRLFERPALGRRILSWFGRFAIAFKAPKPVTLQVSGIESMTGADEVRVVRRVGPGATLDQRVAVLEENLNLLRDELNTRVQRVHRDLATVREDVQRESQERTAADEKTARIIEEIGIGGLNLEMVGLFWLVVGVVGTSIPDELGAWLSLIT